MSDKAIVLDANILIRAVLGRRVREIILTYAQTVAFFAPDIAFVDARKYLPAISIKRGLDPTAVLAVLECLAALVQQLESSVYRGAQAQALQRIGKRDADDWPVLASAMTLGCPVWTEDVDFFGTGIPTWTTNRVEQYFAA